MRIELEAEGLEYVIGNILEEVAEEMEYLMKYYIELKNAIATFDLYKSIGREQVDELIFDIGSDAPHAGAVEFGTHPHTPPYDEIYDWVVIKKGESGKEAREATWKIINKIKKEGTSPKSFIGPAVADLVVKYGR